MSSADSQPAPRAAEPTQAGERPNLIDYEEAAARLGLLIGTLRVMVSRKRVPHIRLGPRMVKFDPDELDRWIDERRHPVQP